MIASAKVPATADWSHAIRCLSLPLQDNIWSVQRIRLPARTKRCSHTNCFDLYGHVSSNVGKDGRGVQQTNKSIRAGRQTLYPAFPQGKWACPLCKANAGWSDLVIDETFVKVLASIGDKSSAKAVTVSCYAAGTPAAITANNAMAHSSMAHTGLSGVVLLDGGQQQKGGGRGELELHWVAKVEQQRSQAQMVDAGDIEEIDLS